MKITSCRPVLDARRADTDGRCPLRIRITRLGRTAYITTGAKCLPSQWDAAKARMTGRTPQASAVNAMLTARTAAVEAAVLSLIAEGSITPSTSAADIRRLIETDTTAEKSTSRPLKGSLARFMEKVVQQRHGRTKALYEATQRKLELFLGDCYLRTDLDGISAGWLTDFDTWLAETSPSANSRSIHLRNLRKVFNAAIDDQATSNYPFRRFHIRQEPTRKRALTLGQLRQIIAFQPATSQQAAAKDYFLLTFMLIGINAKDLHSLKEITQDGRIEYRRAKTHRPYSLRVEPEAADFIARHPGVRGLLDCSDYPGADYRLWYQSLCRGLDALQRSMKDRGLELPHFTTYWARHTWATLAASLDIPKETIAAALGHGGNSVTDIYIDFDRSKIDRAARAVLDFVFSPRS